MQGMETEWRRLGEVARGAETVSRGFGAFCVLEDSGGHFAGLMAALHSAPPPFPMS